MVFSFGFWYMGLSDGNRIFETFFTFLYFSVSYTFPYFSVSYTFLYFYFLNFLYNFFFSVSYTFPYFSVSYTFPYFSVSYTFLYLVSCFVFSASLGPSHLTLAPCVTCRT